MSVAVAVVSTVGVPVVIVVSIVGVSVVKTSSVVESCVVVGASESPLGKTNGAVSERYREKGLV